MKGYTVLNPRTIDTQELARETFALDVLMGLSTERKFIPPKYFYDARGSKLFQEITELPEYYPTRCEFEIFEQHKDEIARLFAGVSFSLIELGAGDGRKTKVLLKAFEQKKLKLQYVPIDISETSVADLSASISAAHPKIPCRGVVAEYFDALRMLNRESTGRKLVLFLGSNIGNFTNPESRKFLRALWNALNPGDYVLLGFDLKKGIEILIPAYNDQRGITSRFNLNVLTRVNRELGGDFDLKKFRHFGSYNVLSGAMESYLVSYEAHTVNVKALNKSFRFKAFEPLHLEYSFKFLAEDALKLADETGYSVAATYYDSNRYFMDSIWKVEKGK